MSMRRMTDVVTSRERRTELKPADLRTNDTIPEKIVEHVTVTPNSVAVVDGTEGREKACGVLLRDVRARITNRSSPRAKIQFSARVRIVRKDGLND